MAPVIRQEIDRIVQLGPTDRSFDLLGEMRTVLLECYDDEGVAYCESAFEGLIALVQ